VDVLLAKQALDQAFSVEAYLGNKHLSLHQQPHPQFPYLHLLFSVSLQYRLQILIAMDLCNYCSAIPFTQLPAENEDALPHQPDLDSLRASAKTCLLCDLLLEVVHEQLAEVGEPGANSPAHFFYWINSQDGVMMHVREASRRAYFEFSLTDDNVEAEPVLLFPNGPKAKETNGPLRPWLYGNWWLVPGCGSELKLLGMGVRVARGPSPFDAVKEEDPGVVYIRGSPLRLQTWFGTYLSACAEECIVQY